MHCIVYELIVSITRYDTVNRTVNLLPSHIHGTVNEAHRLLYVRMFLSTFVLIGIQYYRTLHGIPPLSFSSHS